MFALLALGVEVLKYESIEGRVYDARDEDS
jgi:hypothetical protein